MTLDTTPPPADAGDEVGFEVPDWDVALAEAIAPADLVQPPDSVDRVVELADMMSVFAAQRFIEIDVMRREFLGDARRHGRALLCDLLIEGITASHPSEARGIRATVAVTVPALALLDGDVQGAEPAVVEGIGPIPLDRARELCGGAEGWMRILTHPETGMVLSVGRGQYRPPPALRRLVRWRADRCMAPGCGMPASRCEIDHSIAREHGGETSLQNLDPLCTGHHTVKHHGDWAVRHLDGGALEWVSPSGRRYVVQPERRVPIFRPSDECDAPF